MNALLIITANPDHCSYQISEARVCRAGREIPRPC